MAVSRFYVALAIMLLSKAPLARMIPKETMVKAKKDVTVKPLPLASIKQHRVASLLAAETSEAGEVHILAKHKDASGQASQQAPFVPNGVYSPTANAVVKPMDNPNQASAILLNPQMPNPQTLGHDILQWATPSSHSNDDEHFRVLGPAAATVFLEDTLDSPLSHDDAFPMLHVEQSSSVQGSSMQPSAVQSPSMQNATVPIPTQDNGATSHGYSYVSKSLACGEKFHIFQYHLCHLHLWIMFIVYLGLALFACLCFWTWNHIPIKFANQDDASVSGPGIKFAPAFYSRRMATPKPLHMTGATTVPHASNIKYGALTEESVILPVGALPVNMYTASPLPVVQSTSVPVGTPTTLPVVTSTVLPVRTSVGSLSSFSTSSALPVRADAARTTLPAVTATSG